MATLQINMIVSRLEDIVNGCTEADPDTIDQLQALLEYIHKGPMTQAEFLAEDGQLCPVCRNDDMRRVGGVEGFDGDGETTFWKRWHCNFCGAEWNRIYDNVGYDGFTFDTPRESPNLD